MNNSKTLINKIQSNQQNTIIDTEDHTLSIKAKTQKELINRYGILSGIVMAIFMYFFSNTGVTTHLSLHFGKYIFLGLALAFVLSRYVRISDKYFIYNYGLLIGLWTSAVSGLTYILAYGLINSIGSNNLVDRYGESIETFSRFLLISVGTFMETIVFGMIITLIVLQVLKKPRAGA